MSTSTPLYNQLFSLLSQHSKYRDLRHFKALAWMVNSLIGSGKINFLSSTAKGDRRFS